MKKTFKKILKNYTFQSQCSVKNSNFVNNLYYCCFGHKKNIGACVQNQYFASTISCIIFFVDQEYACNLQHSDTNNRIRLSANFLSQGCQTHLVLWARFAHFLRGPDFQIITRSIFLFIVYSVL